MQVPSNCIHVDSNAPLCQSNRFEHEFLVALHMCGIQRFRAYPPFIYQITEEHESLRLLAHMEMCHSSLTGQGSADICAFYNPGNLMSKRSTRPSVGYGNFAGSDNLVHE